MIITLIVFALILVILSNWMAWLIVKKKSKIEELIGKMGELEESNRGQFDLLTQYEKDIIKLEDENKSYKKVLGNLQNEVDVLIDEKRVVEGKTKDIKKQLEDEKFNLSTITNALGRVIGDKKSTDLARENSNHFEFILKAIHEIEKEKTEFLNILGEYDLEKNEYALQNNCKDREDMIGTVENCIKLIFKQFYMTKELNKYEDCPYESIPWALEQIREKMNEWVKEILKKDNDIAILEEFKEVKEAESI